MELPAPRKRGRPRKEAPHVAPTTPPVLDLEALSKRKPTLTPAEAFSLLGGLPGFTSERTIWRRIQRGTMPGYVKPDGSRGYILTRLLAAHLVGQDAA